MPATFSLRPPGQGRLQSSFHGLTASFQRLHVGTQARQQCVQVQALRKCDLTGQKANNGWAVSFSHSRSHKLQGVNLQYKRIYWPEKQRWVQLRISAKTLKTIQKRGLEVMAKEAGVDLMKLPFVDVRPQRLEWVAKQPKYPAMNKDKIGTSRRMKNPAKLAASKKKPLVARYEVGNTVVLTRDPRLVEEYRQ